MFSNVFEIALSQRHGDAPGQHPAKYHSARSLSVSGICVRDITRFASIASSQYTSRTAVPADHFKCAPIERYGGVW
jgi:hypothetical protein